MPVIKVKRKIIDQKTGGYSYKTIRKRIGVTDPNNYIEFHRISDILGLDAYARLDSRISGKVATIYNYLSKVLRTDDVYKMYDWINKFKRETRSDNINGKELVSKLYMMYRMSGDKGKDEAKEKIIDFKTARGIEEEKIKGESERADKLRKTFINSGEYKSQETLIREAMKNGS